MISNAGYNEGFITLYVTEGTKQNDIVYISRNETCSPCMENDIFCGVVKGIRNGIATVQVKGYVELKYSESTISLGKTTLVADGMGGVKESIDGSPVFVFSVDDEASTIKAIL